jgi:predicted aspartyl protease
MAAAVQFRALTTKANGIAQVLEVPVKVAPPLLTSDAKPDRTRDCHGVWDTGAMAMVITQAVADDLDLKPITFTEVHTANGSSRRPVYMVALLLPNGVMVNTRATSAPSLMGCDALIGMDIIGLGDFSVTNVGGKTTVSFRMPSCEEIDYVAQAKRQGAPGGRPSRYERRHPGTPQPSKPKRPRR